MQRRFRTLNDSESGLISVSAVIGIAFLGLIVYLLLAALNGDTTHYGTVPVPSQNVQIDLPEGETEMYLAESGTEGDVAVPTDLKYNFQSANGDTVRIDDRDGDTKETDDGITKNIAAVIAPRAGTYLLTVTSDQAAQLSMPELTFGLSPLGAVHERFDDVVDTLNGPTGIVVLVGLLLLALTPRFLRALDR